MCPQCEDQTGENAHGHTRQEVITIVWAKAMAWGYEELLEFKETKEVKSTGLSELDIAMARWGCRCSLFHTLAKWHR